MLNEVPFSDDDFQALARLAHREFGLSLAESKKPLVYSRLSRRLKARQIDSFPAYLRLLDDVSENAERLELISALTTNVTSFFRENHHFETLRNDCLPEAIDRVRKNGRLRIWSAGCSSGQEPYGIAMTLLDMCPEIKKFNARILATDIDPQIVAKARLGRYPAEEAASIPERYRQKWARLSNQDKTSFTISDEVKALVTFAELNLIADWPFSGPFDAIFCRNVAIYFDQETQKRLWSRFAEKLAPDGHLFIGHSERVTGPAIANLTGVGITSYRKSTTTVSKQLQ